MSLLREPAQATCGAYPGAAERKPRLLWPVWRELRVIFPTSYCPVTDLALSISYRDRQVLLTNEDVAGCVSSVSLGTWLPDLCRVAVGRLWRHRLDSLSEFMLPPQGGFAAPRMVLSPAAGAPLGACEKHRDLDLPPGLLCYLTAS